ncbi:MAG: NDP-sugar synthase [Vicinamibacteria bacterium]|jgi:NDP-sugar pyrophosphorylase family protein|nr:NDP-sugar synthase [Vicinamibacteria bacterium]MBP9947452.1 NDP-sugar synthase [Vicinamibacteria bacterium]
MKTSAIILVGGEGTRLRPLTLELPKPVVPVLDRPFLKFQLDLLRKAGIVDIVLCVAFRPERIRAVLGDGANDGVRLTYVLEETPLGTGGAVKNAEGALGERVVVMNGDVLADMDLEAILRLHDQSQAAATIVLHPVDNPSAYGLVETDEDGRVRRFIEKPKPEEITTNRINAGLYVLETRTLSIMPKGVPYSIERGYFPTLIQSGERVQAYTHAGYWIDIGSHQKYLQVHLDLLSRRFPHQIDATPHGAGFVHQSAIVDPAAVLEGHFYIGPGCRIGPGARIEDGSTLIENVRVQGGTVRRSVIWSGTEIGEGSVVEGALLANRVRVGRHCHVLSGAALGDGTVVSDHSRTA